MREEECTCLLTLHELSTQYVESREEPASSAMLLVGDPRALDFDREMIIESFGAMAIDEEVFHAITSDGILQSLVSRTNRIGLTKIFE